MPKLALARSVSARPFTQAEVYEILDVLNDRRSWPVGPWTLQNASSANQRHDEFTWTISLETNAYIDTLVQSKSPALYGLSVTFMAKRHTMFSLENWNSMPAASRPRMNQPGFASQKAYRVYVINHECGHGLGLMHARPMPYEELCPVMYQQSRGFAGHKPNGWPLAREIAKLEQIQRTK